ncbi:MAG TPA: serine hydrolase domain-containing protein, partial [Anaerolineaceae bacterium]|nr:serine hydrolase domain-containing protein [Anaerolineaceae bacterium]
GAAVGLIHDGKIVDLRGYGLADAENGLPVTENTVFQAASISKSLTAWGVMNLVEQGKLGLDEPVSKYLTRWELPPSKYDASGVTIRRLLSHTAGIAHVGGYAGFSPDEPLQTLEESLVSAKDAFGRGVSIVRQPGTRYEYSGGGYTLLQLVIEEVTQRPFEAYMQDEVLAPLGMDHSSFTLDAALQSNLAIVYDKHGKPSTSRSFTAKAAAGLYTTAQDLTSWAMAMIPSGATPPDGQVLQAETLQEMYLPQAGTTNFSSYGLGYMVQKILFTDLMEVYHTGTNLPGWCAVVATVPEKGEGLVLMTNASGGAALRHQIHSAWLGWVTGSSTLALRTEKLGNLLLYILPIGFIGGVVLLIASKVTKGKGKSKSPRQ